jgi:hypothetical protein
MIYRTDIGTFEDGERVRYRRDHELYGDGIVDRTAYPDVRPGFVPIRFDNGYATSIRANAGHPIVKTVHGFVEGELIKQDPRGFSGNIGRTWLVDFSVYEDEGQDGGPWDDVDKVEYVPARAIDNGEAQGFMPSSVESLCPRRTA